MYCIYAVKFTSPVYIMQLHSLGNFIPFVPCNQYIDRNSLKCHKLSGLNAENWGRLSERWISHYPLDKSLSDV